MNFRMILFLLATVLVLQSFQLPKNIQKKMDKEIKMAFDVETYTLESIQVSDEINKQLQAKITTDNFYKIIHNNTIIGVAFVDKAPSKTDQFDYLVLFDAELIIKKAKVLIYREDYGGEIGSKRWLKQFVGKSSHDKLQYRKDIIAISGATISANSMTLAINNVLQTIGILHHKNII